MKEKVINLLMIGPFPNPITGNSISNKVVFEGLNNESHIKINKINTALPFFYENIGFFSFRKLLNCLRFTLEGYKLFKSNVVYITPGQSFFGISKYAVLIFMSKLLRNRLVVHIHGDFIRQEYQKLNPLKRFISKIIIGRADAGIVLSNKLMDNLTPFLKREKIFVINNFVEDYVLNNSKNLVTKKSLKTLKIIYLSNLMEEKGILDLFKALEFLEKIGINYKAQIAGNIDSSSKEQIDDYLSKLKKTTYIGVVEGNKKRDLLYWGNLFIFPSYYKMEGQPLAVLEAMATGNVVLATNHAGISDVFSTKNGLFIDIKNPHDIVEKIKIILEKKEYYNQVIQNNHTYASSEFKTEKFIKSIRKVVCK